MNPTILLNSGNYFNFLEPWNTPISIEEIALGLSKKCRFSGQCDGFYSVAQHSVLVSYIVPSELAYEGLMHEVAEATMCDVPSPLKKLLPSYKEIENIIEESILAQFNINFPLHPKVKEADLIALATEKRDFMNTKDSWYFEEHNGIKAIKTELVQLNEREAYNLFLNKYYELTNKFYQGDLFKC